MHELIRYTSTEFIDVWEDITELEDKLLFYFNRRPEKKFTIKTSFYYYVEEDVWEGELEVTDAEEDKRNSKGNSRKT